MMELELNSQSDRDMLSLEDEMGAYEALWCQDGATFRRLAQQFAQHPNYLPSQFVTPGEAAEYRDRVLEIMGPRPFDLRLHGTGEYPVELRDARYPAEMIYYQGDWSLNYSPKIAVVGTRKPTAQGVRRTRQLVRRLVADGYTIVSGLASGIDTIAHETAIESGGYTIAVIGTPLSECYPRGNTALQQCIATDHLVVSPVPFVRYANQRPPQNRIFFPERNAVMCALTEGTIIVEASDTSGTMHQAKAAIQQGRKLFILESCFQYESIAWPQRFSEYNKAYSVTAYGDIRNELCHGSSNLNNENLNAGDI